MPAPRTANTWDNERVQKYSDTLIYRNQRVIFPFMAVGLSMGGFYVTSAGPLISTLSRDLQVSPASLSWLGSAYGVAMVVAGLTAPLLLRNGPVWSLRLAPALILCGIPLLLWAPNAGTAIVGTQLACLGGGLISAAVPATFTGQAGTKYLAWTTSVASGVSILTTVLFGATEKILPGYGRFAVLFSLIPVLFTLVSAWRLPALPLHQAFKPKPETLDTHTSLNTPPPPRPRPSRVLLGAQVLRIILVAAVEFAIYAWAVSRLVEVGATLSLASTLATIFAVGMTLGRALGAPIAAKPQAWLGFTVLSLVGTLLVGYVPQLWAVVAGLGLAGLGISCLYPIVSTDFSSLPGMRPQVVAVYVSGLSGVGALVSPLVLGALLDDFGLRGGFGVLAACFVALALLPRPAAKGPNST